MPQMIVIEDVPIESYRYELKRQFVSDEVLNMLEDVEWSQRNPAVLHTTCQLPRHQCELVHRRALVGYGILGLGAVLLAFAGGISGGLAVQSSLGGQVDVKAMTITCVILLGLAVEVAVAIVWFATKVNNSTKASGYAQKTKCG